MLSCYSVKNAAYALSDTGKHCLKKQTALLYTILSSGVVHETDFSCDATESRQVRGRAYNLFLWLFTNLGCVLWQTTYQTTHKTCVFD